MHGWVDFGSTVKTLTRPLVTPQLPFSAPARAKAITHRAPLPVSHCPLLNSHVYPPPYLKHAHTHTHRPGCWLGLPAMSTSNAACGCPAFAPSASTTRMSAAACAGRPTLRQVGAFAQGVVAFLHGLSRTLMDLVMPRMHRRLSLYACWRCSRHTFLLARTEKHTNAKHSPTSSSLAGAALRAA